MSKNLSNNQPLRTTDKSYIKTFPKEDTYVAPAFNCIPPLLGKTKNSANILNILNSFLG